MANLFDTLMGKDKTKPLLPVDPDVKQRAEEALREELAKGYGRISDTTRTPGHFNIVIPDHFGDGKNGTIEVAIDMTPKGLKAASNLMQAAATHQDFDFGNGVQGWTTVIDGHRAVHMDTPFGRNPIVDQKDCHTEPQANGRLRFTHSSGSSYESFRTRDGNMFDLSQTTPQAGMEFSVGLSKFGAKTGPVHGKNYYYGNVKGGYDASGELKFTVTGNVKPNDFLIKGPDGGIRTVDEKGNLMVSTLSDKQMRKQGLSEDEIANHRAFEQRGGQAAMPRVQPQNAIEQKAKPPLSQDVRQALGEVGSNIAKFLEQAQAQQGTSEQGSAPAKPNRAPIQR